MAMTKCRECGKDVSTEVQACPHCGAVTSGKKSVDKATSAARIILMTIGILSALPAVAFGGGLGLIVPAIFIILALCLK